MHMALKDVIFRRRSVRSYESRRLPDTMLAELMDFISSVKQLDPDIRVEARVLEKSQVSTTQPWATPHYLAIASEEKPGWLENAGFMFQQVDLYLQEKGLGSCWVGLGKVDETLIPEGMKHVILMPFGYPKDAPERSSDSDFRRKNMDEITDCADERLEVVRIAPSACNSQPWYFVHEGENTLHMYREGLGLLKRRTLEKWNQVDVGIALAHLYLMHGEQFCFTRMEGAPEKKGYIYMGTVKLA